MKACILFSYPRDAKSHYFQNIGGLDRLESAKITDNKRTDVCLKFFTGLCDRILYRFSGTKTIRLGIPQPREMVRDTCHLPS